MSELAEYRKAERFGKRLERLFPWVLLAFFIGLGLGYAWAYHHFA